MKVVKLATFLAIAFLSPVLVRAESEETPLATDNPKAVALYQACQKGDLDEVKDLVGGGAPLDGQVGSYAFTPLIAAAYKAHLDVLKYLIDYRAKVDLVDNEGSSPLLHACAETHTDCALALIDAGANVNLASNFGRTPLMYSAQHGDDRTVAALIAHKVNLDANCDEGPALHWAAWNDHLSTVKLLCAAGANPNLLPDGGKSSLYSVLGCAAAFNDLDMIDYLLGLKVDVNSPNAEGTTPLMAAVTYGRPEAIERLADNGANLNLKNKDGQTALIMACMERRPDCVRALLERKADVNVADSHGETALTIAGDTGEADTVDLLKNRGAQRTDVHVIAKEPRWQNSPARAFALSVGMIYTQRDRANPTVLGGDKSAQNCQTMLKRDWNITDKASLVQELDELRDRGHHSLYQDEGAKLALMNDDQFNQLLAAHADNTAKIKAMRASYLKWKEKSGLAWDICRSANLVNAGFAAHYLGAKEAWDRLMALAKQARGIFGSWREMSDNFLDGREIWANKRDPHFEACANLLLNPKDPNSPWNQNPWDTDLSGD